MLTKNAVDTLTQNIERMQELLVDTMLRVLRREIVEHLEGRFKDFHVYRVICLPSERAIAIQKRYTMSYGKTHQRWGQAALQAVRIEHPSIEFTLLRTREVVEPEDNWLTPKTFEAVIRLEG